MTVDELKNIKISLGLTNNEIADRSGVPLGTVQKIFAGITSAPRRKTLLAIEKALKSAYTFDSSHTSDILSDTTATYYGDHTTKNSYDKQGQYTVDDYYAISQKKRIELIDGIIYDMTAPSFDHQTIVLYIANQILPCVEAHRECQVAISPVDVQLDRDNMTMVQPDLLILCDPSKNINRCIYGAPDFVLEVLSPSTKKKDMFLKLHKYADAGCREYWIVDQQSEHIIVYMFDEDQVIRMYTFSDKVPIGISDGRCEVDFNIIKERLRWGHAEQEK